MNAGAAIRHATFTIDRSFDASPTLVFRAWADPAMKARWFHGPEEWSNDGLNLDFRKGGKETESGGPKEGPTHYYGATYQHIVENERIIYTYDMHLDDVCISVSVVTVQLEAAGNGTRMLFTEQAVYMMDGDGPEGREEGTRQLLDQLAAELARMKGTGR